MTKKENEKAVKGNQNRPLMRGIFRCSHCGDIGTVDSTRVPSYKAPPTADCRNEKCRAQMGPKSMANSTGWRSPRVRVGRPDSTNPCVALYLEHEGLKRDMAQARLSKVVCGKDAIEEHDLYRAVNPRWIPKDPIPRPISRAMKWGVY
jgi:hypothetical protein